MSHEEHIHSDDHDSLAETAILHTMISEFDSFASMFEYICSMYDAHSDTRTVGQLSIVDTLTMVGSMLDENRPGLGKDPNNPEQSAFMMGSFAALDLGVRMIRAKGYEIEDILDEWTDSSQFIEDSSVTAASDQLKMVGESINRMSLARLASLSPRYLSVMKHITDRALDDGIIVTDQVPSLSKGFAFTLEGIRTTLDLRVMKRELSNGIDEDELAAWLAG